MLLGSMRKVTIICLITDYLFHGILICNYSPLRAYSPKNQAPFPRPVYSFYYPRGALPSPTAGLPLCQLSSGASGLSRGAVKHLVRPRKSPGRAGAGLLMNTEVFVRHRLMAFYPSRRTAFLLGRAVPCFYPGGNSYPDAVALLHQLSSFTAR